MNILKTEEETDWKQMANISLSLDPETGQEPQKRGDLTIPASLNRSQQWGSPL